MQIMQGLRGASFATLRFTALRTTEPFSLATTTWQRQPFPARALSTAPNDDNASDINDVRAVKQRVGSWQRAEL